ncbi:MAG: DUF4404 family protein [Verrucomicrobiales bacterium]|nr:DUF4404 family protein [Verrucomicrobiales bacterium]
MTKDQLVQSLREKLAAAQGLPEETRQNLLKLVDELAAADEGTSDVTVPECEEEPHGLARVTHYVEELEASHPDVANLLGQVSVVLSKMGL